MEEDIYSIWGPRKGGKEGYKRAKREWLGKRHYGCKRGNGHHATKSGLICQKILRRKVRGRTTVRGLGIVGLAFDNHNPRRRGAPLLASKAGPC